MIVTPPFPSPQLSFVHFEIWRATRGMNYGPLSPIENGHAPKSLPGIFVIYGHFRPFLPLP